MDEFTVAFVKALIGFIAVSGVGLSAYWLRLRSRALPGSELRDEVLRLREEVEELRALTEGRLPEVEERLDFVERRLVEPMPPRTLDRPSPTPA